MAGVPITELVAAAPGGILGSVGYGHPWHVLRLAAPGPVLSSACGYPAGDWTRSAEPPEWERGCANCLAALRRDGQGGVRAAGSWSAEQSRAVRAAVSAALRGRDPSV